MGGIVRTCIIFLVARVAGRAAQIVVVLDMAVGALPRRHLMRTRQRESSAAVIERRIQP